MTGCWEHNSCTEYTVV